MRQENQILVGKTPGQAGTQRAAPLH